MQKADEDAYVHSMRSQIRNEKTTLPALQTVGNTEKLFLYNLSRRFRVQILFIEHTSSNQTAQHIYNRRPSLQSYQLHPVRYEDVPQTRNAHRFVEQSHRRITLCSHPRSFQAFKKSQISLQKLGLIVSIIADIMAIATEIKPINRTAIPEHGALVLAAGPVGAAVVAVAREQLGKESSDAAVPGHLGDVGAEEGKGASTLRRAGDRLRRRGRASVGKGPRRDETKEGVNVEEEMMMMIPDGELASHQSWEPKIWVWE